MRQVVLVSVLLLCNLVSLAFGVDAWAESAETFPCLYDKVGENLTPKEALDPSFLSLQEVVTGTVSKPCKKAPCDSGTYLRDSNENGELTFGEAKEEIHADLAWCKKLPAAAVAQVPACASLAQMAAPTMYYKLVNVDGKAGCMQISGISGRTAGAFGGKQGRCASQGYTVSHGTKKVPFVGTVMGFSKN